MAEASLTPFKFLVEDSGVVGVITVNGMEWYEEWTAEPLEACACRNDLFPLGIEGSLFATGNETAEHLFSRGVKSVEASIGLFDNGYWSNYDLAEKGLEATASMNYHNLHICQLMALYHQTQNDVFCRYSNIFLMYAEHPYNRIRAVKDIISRKLRGV